jgi:hypothetical protein
MLHFVCLRLANRRSVFNRASAPASGEGYQTEVAASIRHVSARQPLRRDWPIVGIADRALGKGVLAILALADVLSKALPEARDSSQKGLGSSHNGRASNPNTSGWRIFAGQQ